MNFITYAVIASVTVFVATTEARVIGKKITQQFQTIGCALDGSKFCVLR